MEIREKVVIVRPSWANDKGKFIELLCSKKPWLFESNKKNYDKKS